MCAYSKEKGYEGYVFFFFSSRRRHTRYWRDWSSDVCSSDLGMGLAPILVERIYETIAEINEQGTTILLVEQNANFALEVSNRGYVLEVGTVAEIGRAPCRERV